MQVNIDCCFFVLENVLNENKRKNDNKKLKLLVDNNNNLITTPFSNKDLKETIRSKIKEIINSNDFHLEQVYTLGDEKFLNSGLSIIYLGITNEENIKNIDSNYKLIDIDFIDKKQVLFDNKLISYDTKLRKENNSLEFFHNIKTDNIELEKMIIELITSYKQIISKIDYTDIMFKFLPKYFALEDVRIVYEKITETSVDKSNFRKRIMKYCKATDKIISNKGYRPTQLFEFIPLEDDIWI